MGAFDDLVKTPNFKLNKPGYDNVADIEALNENFDIIDNLLKPSTLLLYVDANTNDGGNGTENKPFKTIQAAVEAIKHTVNSVTIYIAPGTYAEDVNVLRIPCTTLHIYPSVANNPPNIKSITIQQISTVSMQNLKFYGVNSNNRAIEIDYADVAFSNISVTGDGGADIGIMLHSASGIIDGYNISGFNSGIYALYGSSVQLLNGVITNNNHDLFVDGATLFTDTTISNVRSERGGLVINRAVGEALTKDLYSVLIEENTFRNRALASAMSNVISTLFMEVFADTDGINKSLGDAATAIENYYNARGHIFEKTDSGTITLYTLSQTVNTGNGKVWVYADYVSKGGSVELAISRDGGTTYTVVSEGVLTDISTRPAGTTMSLRIKITGAVTLKNISWGCK